MKKIEIVLPFFPGYHNSILDSFIDQEIEMRMEESGKTYVDIEECLDYQKAFHEITIQWLNRFNAEAGFNIEFKEVDSPREYNFTTDKLIGLISVDEVKNAMAKCNSNIDIFKNEVLDKYFKSYDGFMSFYSNDVDDWFNKDIEDLDCNETMAYITGSILVDMDEEDLLSSIHDHHSVYEAAQHVFK
jgi:hypothetical protein